MVYTIMMNGGTGIPSDMIFIDLVIQDPQTFTGDKGRITTYEIALETNSISFILKSSRIRRRFEEFVWLREQLQDIHGLSDLPPLPGGGLLRMFGRQFDKEFIRERQKLLQQFTEKIVREPEILSDPMLHLFLQTQLPPNEIIRVKKGETGKSVVDTILGSEDNQLDVSSDSSASSGFIEVSDSDSCGSGYLVIGPHGNIQDATDTDEEDFSIPPLTIVRKTSDPLPQRHSFSKKHTFYAKEEGQNFKHKDKRRTVTFNDVPSVSL
ncbi:sorting nexin-10-like [Branchiostoma lanceolatum]|uniref:sorting nexin-10-like n=1 Tax=Branchiostoma lanceolatum TaxID=7740 RepID=UPI0034515306